MIHTMLRISALALMLNMIASADQSLQQEVNKTEDGHELIILVNDKARDLCKRTVDCWHKAGLAYNDAALDELLDPQIALVDYSTMLSGLKSCLNEQWAPVTQEELALKEAVKQEHDLIQNEYEELVAQIGSRRIKIKYYAKVITGELVVSNTATINSLIVNNCIQFPNLPAGVLQVTDGCLTTTVIPPFTITPGSIGTAQLADGAVTTPKIADANVTGAKIDTQTVTGGAGGNIALATITNANIVPGTITGTNIGAGQITTTNIAASTILGSNIDSSTITQTNLAFNTVQVPSTEPFPAGGTVPLMVYRGLFNPVTGAALSGAGFTLDGTSNVANGLYVYNVSTAYQSTTSYAVIVQPTSISPAGGNGFFRVSFNSTSQFQIQFYLSSDGSTAAQPIGNFSVFVIGS